jgi:hypothetical protein
MRRLSTESVPWTTTATIPCKPRQQI